MSEPDTPTNRMDPELRTHVTRAFDFDTPPETYEAFWRNLIGTFADALDRSVTVQDLCTTDDSPHMATVNGQTQHYQCVTDGFILGSYLDEEVTVRTESAVEGTELVVEFDADGVVSVPEDAVVSFGVERSVTMSDGPITPEKTYGRFCPYSKAFASREEYEQWDEANPGVVSDIQPLDEYLRLQAGLLDADGGTEFGGSTTPSCGNCGC
jgi:hypothetical protein